MRKHALLQYITAHGEMTYILLFLLKLQETRPNTSVYFIIQRRFFALKYYLTYASIFDNWVLHTEKYWYIWAELKFLWHRTFVIYQVDFQRQRWSIYFKQSKIHNNIKSITHIIFFAYLFLPWIRLSFIGSCFEEILKNHWNNAEQGTKNYNTFQI